MIWLLLAVPLALAAGGVGGSFAVIRLLPRILSRFSTEQLRDLAARSASLRPQADLRDLNSRVAEADRVVRERNRLEMMGQKTEWA